MPPWAGSRAKTGAPLSNTTVEGEIYLNLPDAGAAQNTLYVGGNNCGAGLDVAMSTILDKKLSTIVSNSYLVGTDNDTSLATAPCYEAVTGVGSMSVRFAMSIAER